MANFNNRYLKNFCYCFCFRQVIVISLILLSWGGEVSAQRVFNIDPNNPNRGVFCFGPNEVQEINCARQITTLCGNNTFVMAAHGQPGCFTEGYEVTAAFRECFRNSGREYGVLISCSGGARQSGIFGAIPTASQVCTQSLSELWCPSQRVMAFSNPITCFAQDGYVTFCPFPIENSGLAIGSEDGRMMAREHLCDSFEGINPMMHTRCRSPVLAGPNDFKECLSEAKGVIICSAKGDTYYPKDGMPHTVLANPPKLCNGPLLFEPKPMLGTNLASGTSIGGNGLGFGPARGPRLKTKAGGGVVGILSACACMEYQLACEDGRVSPSTAQNINNVCDASNKIFVTGLPQPGSCGGHTPGDELLNWCASKVYSLYKNCRTEYAAEKSRLQNNVQCYKDQEFLYLTGRSASPPWDGF